MGMHDLNGFRAIANTCIFKTCHDPEAKSNVRVIRSGKGYDKILRELRDQELFELVQKQTLALPKFIKNLITNFKKQLGSGFSGIRNYFLQMVKYDSEIAVADVRFITEALDKHRKEARKLADKVSQEVGSILDAAKEVSEAEVFEQLTRLTIRGIIAIFNPLKWFDKLDKGLDVADSLADVTKADKNLGKAEALLNALSMLSEKGKKCERNLKKNEKFLNNIKELIDKVKHGSTSSEDFNRRKASFVKE